MYWSSDLVYKTGIFGEMMPRDHFLLILHFLHFADNATLDPKDQDRDQLGKIRPMINLVWERCAAVYSPARDLCVDESLVLFKGRLAFKQFIRMKRTRSASKSISGARPVAFCLIFSFIMVECPMSCWSFQIISLQALTLMRNFLNKGHRLFVDNFYTTPGMAAFLTEKDTTCWISSLEQEELS